MKKFCLLFGVLFLLGCADRSPVLLQDADNAFPPFEDGILFSSSSRGDALSFLKGDVFFDVPVARSADLFSFTPNRQQILLIDNFETGTEVFLYEHETGNRLLFTSRYPVMYAAWAPSGQAIAFVQNMDTGEARRMDDFRLVVYAFEDQSLKVLAEHAAYPSWSSDSRSLLYTSFAPRDIIRGRIMLQDASDLDVEPFALVEEGVAGIFSGQNVLYVREDPAGFNLYRQRAVTGENTLMGEFNFFSAPDTVHLLQLSPSQDYVLWSRSLKASEDVFETWLVTLDDSSGISASARKIVPVSQRVSWYDFQEILFQPVYDEVFGETPSVRTVSLGQDDSEFFYPMFQTQSFVISFHFDTDPFFFVPSRFSLSTL